MNSEIQISIPKDVENLQLPSPELLTYYRNLDNRVLWLQGEVDEYWIEYVKQIIEWNREDKGLPVEQRKPICFMIFSYGGSLDVNNTVVDAIKMSTTPIYGINCGQCCSAACYIYLACHKRLTFPNATFLIHQGSTEGISGSFAEVMSYAAEYQRKIEELEAYVKANTEIPDDILEERITTEWYISAAEALTYKMTDRIIESLDEVI